VRYKIEKISKKNYNKFRAYSKAIIIIYYTRRSTHIGDGKIPRFFGISYRGEVILVKSPL